MPIPTKLFIPPLRENVISRSRLTDIIQSSLSGKLTLISAPAGFGKTTVICDCIQHLERPVAWISLDQDDNDKLRFLSYLISALKVISDRVGEGILSALRTNPTMGDGLIISGLINDIVEIQQPFVLVLDDYHVITNPEIHEFLASIIENQPLEMHLIIATRSDPPWALARWRVRQEMMEIRTRDLRFSFDEAQTFLNEVMRLSLSEDAVSKLESKTEGWISGLLMAAISLRGREDVNNRIQTFEGSNRFIFDYLVEEVLNQLSNEDREFLIKTAILDRMCAPLCNSILEIQHSQTILLKLDSMNLFIVPLDDQRHWYRYHHLLSDLLSSHLVERKRDEIKKLHLRASIWYEEHDNLPDAIHHACKARDFGRAAQIIERNVLDIIDCGEISGLIQLLSQIPEKSLLAYPWLRIALAWALTQTGSFETARRHLAAVENALEHKPEELRRHITGHIAAMMSYMELLSLKENQKGVTFAQTALEMLPASDLRTRGMVYVTLGTMQRANREPAAALETLQTALEIYQTRKQPYVIIDILSQMAQANREMGLLHKTVQFCQEALDIARQHARGRTGQFPNIAYTMGILGRIYYEWNQLDKAIEISLQGLAISEKWGQANTLLGTYLLLARIFRVQGNYQNALDAIQSAKLAGSQLSDTHEFVIRNHKMLIHLEMGNLSTVENWVNTGSKDFEINEDMRLAEMGPLIVALAINNRSNFLDELMSSLDRLSSAAMQRDIQRQMIKVNIQKAVVFHAQKMSDQSLAVMENALAMGKNEGYVRIFIDHGHPMEEILKKAIRSGIEVAYASGLLSILQADLQVKGKQPRYRESQEYLEALTERETEVLHFLSTDLPIPEIADELIITIGTLRTHIKRIYRKLDAHSRFEAVSRAKELDLLGS